MGTDEREFAEFAEDAIPRLRRVAHGLTPDHHRADDLVQTTLEKMWLRWGRIERRNEPPLAYARTVLLRSYLAGNRRGFGLRESAVPPGSLEIAGADPVPGATERLVLHEALGRLTPRQRAAVVLRHLEGLSVAETAVALGCSEGTVKSTTSDALRLLRADLADREGSIW